MKYFIIMICFQLVLTGNSFCQTYDTTRIELESHYWQSLKSRRAISQLISSNRQHSTAFDSIVSVIQREDSISLSYVIKIIDKYGWLGESDVGSLANNSIFYTIQHSDLSTMQKFYPLFEKSVEKGESNRINLALMEDRILVYMDHPQKYGTQYYYDEDGKKHLSKFDDIALINNRRKKIGLKSLRKQINKGELLIN